jgi:hypothetical protein
MSQTAIESHPQRQSILEALAAGQSPQKISKWCNPPLSHVAIWRYRRNHGLPAMQRAETIVKALQKQGLLKDGEEIGNRAEAIKTVTEQVALDDPILSRIQKSYDRMDGAFATITETKAYDQLAALENAESRKIELHARVTGRLNDNAGTTNNVQILVLPPSTRPESLQSAQGQIGAGEVIDVEPG